MCNGWKLYILIKSHLEGWLYNINKCKKNVVLWNVYVYINYVFGKWYNFE